VKKLLAILLVCFLAVSLLVGCGTQESTDGTGNEDTKASDTGSTNTDSSGTDNGSNSATNGSSSAITDGVYTAQSEKDERGNYATVKITVAGGKITAVDWKELTSDGKEKDENYGKQSGEENYKKAQDALNASKTLGEKLVEVQDVNKIDALTGASNSLKLFKELVNEAFGKTTAQYKDGEYTAQSEKDERGNYASLKLTIKDNKITAVEWKELTSDGKEKDESYGKQAGEESYKKAQEALKASQTLDEKLVELQDVEKIDTLTGASNSLKLFKDLVKEALEKAK